MSERARHTGDGVARRKAHQERQRDEREQREEADRAAGTALPPEEGGVQPQPTKGRHAGEEAGWEVRTRRKTCGVMRAGTRRVRCVAACYHATQSSRSKLVRSA